MVKRKSMKSGFGFLRGEIHFQISHLIATLVSTVILNLSSLSSYNHGLETLFQFAPAHPLPSHHKQSWSAKLDPFIFVIPVTVVITVILVISVIPFILATLGSYPCNPSQLSPPSHPCNPSHPSHPWHNF